MLADEARTGIGRLEQLREQERQAVESEATAVRLRDEAAEIAAQLRQCRDIAERARRDSAAAAQQRQVASAAAAEAPGLAAEAAVARRLLDVLNRLEVAQREHERLRSVSLDVQETALQLRKHAADLREQRIDGMVAELAAFLVDGDPCPVCGSLSHPEPSALRAGAVTRDDERAAQREAELAADRAEVIGRDLAAAASRVQQLSQQARELTAAPPAGSSGADAAAAQEPMSKLPTPAWVRECLAGLESRHGAAQAAGAELAAIESALEELVATINRSERDAAGLHARHQETLLAADTAAQAAESSRSSLQERLDGAASVDAALRAAHRRAQRLADAAEAASRLATASRAA